MPLAPLPMFFDREHPLEVCTGSTLIITCAIMAPEPDLRVIWFWLLALTPSTMSISPPLGQATPVPSVQKAL